MRHRGGTVANPDYPLARILRERRAELGLTLRQVTALSGVDNAYISELENGNALRPSFPTMARLARVYGLSLDDIAREAGGELSPVPRVRRLAGVRQ